MILNTIHDFLAYILVMLVFLSVAISMHEVGHIIFAKYHHLEYKVMFKNGNITVAADWKKLGKNKIYGHILGILFGLPPIIYGGLLYNTPIFFLIYLLACYDDLSAVVIILQDRII